MEIKVIKACRTRYKGESLPFLPGNHEVDDELGLRLIGQGFAQRKVGRKKKEDLVEENKAQPEVKPFTTQSTDETKLG